uniref:receptor protein-tyrosine kinase n=1 Tax=Panagrolaimus davidi TaxID=227884 RepID=A0A914QST8_9BILA
MQISGSSANVRLAHFYPDLDSKRDVMDVAVKTVKRHISFSAIQKEIEIMEECDHENILKFVGWLQEGIHTHIVTEFMHGGNLHSFLRNERNSPTIGQLVSYIMQILDGMIYLGNAHIMHRDLAARNCLLNSTYETLKISDFGLSRKTDNNNEYLLQNDLELPFRWLPFEALKGKESFSIKGDIWAFGIVIWEIFERGQIPYKGMNVNGVTEFLKSGKRLPQPFYCSTEIYSIMLSCWDSEPKKRPEFETLKIHLNSILNRVQPTALSEPEYSSYYETPVKICTDK